MTARHMAPKVRGAPTCGVVGLSLFSPLGDHSSIVFVENSGATGVA